MTLMHHIIADLQFGKIIDFLAFKLLFLLLFLLLRTKNITLRDHHEFQQRILKPPLHMPVIQHDLSGFYLTIPILAVKA